MLTEIRSTLGLVWYEAMRSMEASRGIGMLIEATAPYLTAGRGDLWGRPGIRLDLSSEGLIDLGISSMPLL